VLNHLQAKREFESTGDERALKTTRNVDQGVPHQPSAMRKARNASFLSGRLESWERYHVPSGVRVLLAAVDIQSDRFEVRVWGYGRDRERWLVDGYAIRTTEAGDKIRPASYQEHWAEVTRRVVLSTYRLDASRELRVWRVSVDSAGYATDAETQTTRQAYDWWRGLARDGLGHRVRLIKGRDLAQAAVREIYPDSRKRANRKAKSSGDVPVLELGSTTLKDAAYSDLLRESPGPGYVHLPSWAPGEYLDELIAETRGPKRWEIAHGKRNETWDTLQYCDALWLFYGLDKIDFDAPPPYASSDWETNPEVITPDQRRDLKQKPRRRKRPPKDNGMAPDDWAL
jgi:phage terminase large subunit GpA-like protein